METKSVGSISMRLKAVALSSVLLLGFGAGSIVAVTQSDTGIVEQAYAAKPSKPATPCTIQYNNTTISKTTLASSIAQAKKNNKYISKIVIGNKVKKIKEGAFNDLPASWGCQIEIRSSNLSTKKAVDNCLKGSKVKTVWINPKAIEGKDKSGSWKQVRTAFAKYSGIAANKVIVMAN